ncbi:hypothetical protein SFR_6661 [Streptomyces sp. FR-008]|nr:hypothetical protein SFR_6661 [Streptomyces sp. FR-008]
MRAEAWGGGGNRRGRLPHREVRRLMSLIPGH